MNNKKECEFKTLKTCRVYPVCGKYDICTHYGPIEDCARYWKLKVERAKRRLGVL